MIRVLERLLDDKYLILRDENGPTGSFYGTRLEMLVYLADECDYSDEEIEGIVKAVDSLPSVNLLANCQGYS